MSWTFAQLKVAINALDPIPPTLEDTRAAINAQTTTLQNQPITYGQIKTILKTGDNLDWPTVVARSRMTPTFPPATQTDAAILFAILVVSANDGDILDPTKGYWTKFNVLAANSASLGDISAASTSAIAALITTTGPTWSPTVTAGDIQTALAQP